MARDSTRRLTLSALLVAVMLILGAIEHMIPLPGPSGIKLGLSNSVLLLSIYWLGVPTSFVLMALKVLLSGFLFGGVNAMIYAAAGGLLSMTAMSLMHRIKGISPIGIAAVGAVAHNVGQVIAAIVMLRANAQVTNGLLYYMAILMLVGLVMGLATGTVAKLLMERLPASLRPKPKEKA